MIASANLISTAIEAFAEKHKLHFKKHAHIEGGFSDHAFDYTFPIQDNLSFEFVLGLTDDELHIGFEGFWTYIFPSDEKIDWVISLSEDLLNGQCRLAVYCYKGRVKKRVLEQFVGREWVEKYTAHEKISLPFRKLSVSYIYNEARSDA